MVGLDIQLISLANQTCRPTLIVSYSQNISNHSLKLDLSKNRDRVTRVRRFETAPESDERIEKMPYNSQAVLAVVAKNH